MAIEHDRSRRHQEGSLAVVTGGADAAADQALDISLPPPVVVPTHRGFGCSVTVRSIEHALDAEVDLAFADSGLTWTVVAPLVARGVVNSAGWVAGCDGFSKIRTLARQVLITDKRAVSRCALSLLCKWQYTRCG